MYLKNILINLNKNKLKKLKNNKINKNINKME
jgi:hypothetical protein